MLECVVHLQRWIDQRQRKEKGANRARARAGRCDAMCLHPGASNNRIGLGSVRQMKQAKPHVTADSSVKKSEREVRV
jgi:hypothetical protein